MLLSSEIVKLFCQATSSSGTLTKPGTLSVNDFRRDFIATLFPDANGGTGLSDEEIKHAFFGAMPKSWHTSFEGAGYHEHTSTVENIADYMKIMEQQHPFEARLARTTTSNAGTVNSSTNANANRGNGGNNNNNGNHVPSIGPDDTCPLSYLVQVQTKWTRPT